MDDLAIARTIHVLAIGHWIGGVAFVTTVILPAVAALDPDRRLEAFEAIERRFSSQVKVSVPLAGLSGAYMAERLDIWGRFGERGGWWLLAMAVVWLVFMAILFVIEPLLHRRLAHLSAAGSARLFRFVQRAHWALASVGALVAAAGVAGAHGSLS